MWRCANVLPVLPNAIHGVVFRVTLYRPKHKPAWGIGVRPAGETPSVEEFNTIINRCAKIIVVGTGYNFQRQILLLPILFELPVDKLIRRAIGLG